MELCRDVGVSFEAVLAGTSTHCTTPVKQECVAPSQANISFAARIEQLEV